MRTAVEKVITDHLDSKWFTIEEKKLESGGVIPPMAQNNAKRIVIALIREVVGPLINRSEDPEETIFIPLEDGRRVIEIPARKMKSKEKLLGLRLCRAFGVIDPEYEYNAIKNAGMLKNPNSLIFGDTVVLEGQAMFPSRVSYGSSYSIREKGNLTQKLTHNALSESGTMWDRKEKKHRTSLFTTEYILPGTLFPSFIVLNDPTPEALMHILACLRETTYGAQTSITGSNINNHVIGLAACRNEPPVTSYTITIGSTDLVKSMSLKSLKVKMLDTLRVCNVELFEEDVLKDLLLALDALDEEELAEAYLQLQADAEAVWEYSGLGK